MTYASEVAADSPVLWWRLGESSGTVANDSSAGGTFDGTYNGGPTLGATSLLATDSDTAVSLDGVNDYVSYSGTVIASSSAVSVEMWFKMSTPAAVSYLFQVRNATITSEFRVSMETTGALSVVANPTGTNSASFTTAATTFGDNQPHHLVLTYNDAGDTATLYVDGTSVGSGTVLGTSKLVEVTSVGAGAQANGNTRMAGVIDEFAIYSTALSSTRVSDHYAAGVGSPANEVVLDADMPSVVGAFDLDVSRLVTFEADMPAIEGAVQLDTEAAPASMHFDADMPPVVGGLTLDNLEVTAVRVAGTMPTVEGSVALRAVTADSQVNRAGGWVRNNIGEAVWSPPIEPAPVVVPQQQVVAQSYTAPTVDGTHVLVEPTYTREPAYRDRIVIAGRDVTYFRGAPTPRPEYQLIQPLLWGAASIELPQVAVPFEQPGYGDLAWLKPDAAVVIQRVDVETNQVVKTDYRGNIVAFGINGSNLTIECGGQASGRAALMDHQMLLIQHRTDAGVLTAEAMRHLRLRHDPPLKTTTGIQLINWGGGDKLTYINELVAKMTETDGDQWTLMPDEAGTYRTTLKDLDTIHGTIYLDDARVKADLRRDRAEEPNRVFASGVTPDGMVVKFGAYPGLIQAPAAPYPMNDGSSFGPGTTDGDTDTGDGVTVMAWRLLTAGYIIGATYLEGYGSDMADGIRDLQRDAGLSVTGVMNRNSWRALFDLSVTGYDLRNIRILPAAQKTETKPWRLSASGGLIARNPDYDPRVLWADRTIHMGSGYTRKQIRRWAQSALSDGPVWRGTIEIATGAVIAGNHTPGSPVTELLHSRDIKPGENYRLPLFAGGITVHVAGVSVQNDERASAEGKVTLAVSTQPGDTLPVWAAIQRDRDSRNTVHRSFFAQRRSSAFERDNTFDEVGGVIQPIRLEADNWTVFPVVAKQAGTIEKIRLRVSPAREFVVAVFGRKITPARLRRVTNAPLTVAGRKRWTEENVYDRLNRDYTVLYVAGSDEDPCGYFPRRKTDDDSTLTGRWEDDASFPFVTFKNDTERGSVLWVAVWVGNDTTLAGGRIMWPSAEEY